MKVAVDYWWVVPILAVLLLLLIWMIKRNAKDEKTYEKDFMQGELKPEKHPENSDSKP